MCRRRDDVAETSGSHSRARSLSGKSRSSRRLRRAAASFGGAPAGAPASSSDEKLSRVSRCAFGVSPSPQRLIRMGGILTTRPSRSRSGETGPKRSWKTWRAALRSGGRRSRRRPRCDSPLLACRGVLRADPSACPGVESSYRRVMAGEETSRWPRTKTSQGGHFSGRARAPRLAPLRYLPRAVGPSGGLATRVLTRQRVSPAHRCCCIPSST